MVSLTEARADLARAYEEQRRPGTNHLMTEALAQAIEALLDTDEGMQRTEYGVLITDDGGRYLDQTFQTRSQAEDMVSNRAAVLLLEPGEAKVMERTVTTILGEWRDVEDEREIDDWACKQYGYHQAATRHAREECSQ